MTDWLMIGITAAYVVATVFICIANFKSARATRDQVEESKREYEETRRLQVMPYLQVSFREGLLDEHGDPQTPYSILTISNGEKDNQVSMVRYITFTNVGQGLNHHTKISWNEINKKEKPRFEKDIVIPPQGKWGTNVLFSAQRPESDDPMKKIVTKESIYIEYMDLLGNTYRQHVEIFFVISYTEMHEMYYLISAPELIPPEEELGAPPDKKT